MGQTLIAYHGHHKCGTSWMTSIARQLARGAGLRLLALHERPERTALRELIVARRAEFVVLRNSESRLIADIGPHLGFHVFRDPRDLVVSAYHSHRNSHRVGPEWPELAAHREHLRTVEIEAGLLAEIRFSDPVIRSIAEWEPDPSVLEVRMEDLVDRPYEQTLAIAEHLGLCASDAASGALVGLGRRLRSRGLPSPVGPGPLPIGAILAMAHAHRFEQVTGRAPGTEDPHAHRRSGTPGDWSRLFTPAVREAFAEAWGPALVALGYESNDSWVG